MSCENNVINLKEWRARKLAEMEAESECHTSDGFDIVNHILASLIAPPKVSIHTVSISPECTVTLTLTNCGDKIRLSSQMETRKDKP